MFTVLVMADSSIYFSERLHFSNALWMNWSSSNVHRLHGSVCALWTLAVV